MATATHHARRCGSEAEAAVGTAQNTDVALETAVLQCHADSLTHLPPDTHQKTAD